MRTVKWNPFLSGAVMLLGGVLLWAGAARADISSTNPAAIVVFPKLVVDTSSGTDTVIQLTNTAPHPVNARCFYVNANGHCSNAPTVACDPGGPSSEYCAPPGYCVPGWVETDFALTLTPNQPIAWTVSAGLPALPLTAAQRPAPGGLFDGGSIPAANEDPMIGELKCIEVGDDELPVDSNDLKGEATIEIVTPPDGDGPTIDIEGYNAIGIQAIPGAMDNSTLEAANTLVLGEEYNACPYSLILDHFFDDAPVVNGYVRTGLTLVPCSEDFNTQLPIRTVVQFLVYNEFEQRFSTSRSMTCFSELFLSDIDTRLGNSDGNDYVSIFNIGMEGTLTGQTIIRGVADPTNPAGNGLLGVAEEFHELDQLPYPIYSAAYMLDMSGTRTQNDIIQMPPASPAQ
jgi:hypothetical protein